MALDPGCPRSVLAVVMADPTTERLIHLSGMRPSDMATDLSALIATALVVNAETDNAVGPVARPTAIASVPALRWLDHAPALAS